MLSNNKKPHRLALHDSERRGIFIHTNQLDGTGFKAGDRFSIRKGKRELFSMIIIKDDKGDILYDKNGIFIQRTRRVDILLGGIFEEFRIELDESDPNRLIIKPNEECLR